MTLDDWIYAGRMLAVMAPVVGLPAVVVLAVADWAEGGRRPWKRLWQCLALCGLAAVAYGQSVPAWAQQQQMEDVRRLTRDMEQVRSDVRDNTKDLGFLEKTVENGQRIDASERATMRQDIGDHETRLRDVEANVIRVLALCGILAIATPGIFHLIMLAIQRKNGRNGHTNGGPK